MIKNYRKKPLTIQAVQWRGDNMLEIHQFAGQDFYGLAPCGKLQINTLEGTMTGDVGCFVIRGVCGEHYICVEDIFLETYEEVTDG